MKNEKIFNSGTEIFYALGTARRYWIEKRTEEERPPTWNPKGKPRPTTVYHLIDDTGKRTQTTIPEDLVPASEARVAYATEHGAETPSAIRFLRHVQEERQTQFEPGDLVTFCDPEEHEKDPNHTWKVTRKFWEDSDDSPAYGFWIHEIRNTTTGEEEGWVEDELQAYQGPE